MARRKMTKKERLDLSRKIKAGIRRKKKAETVAVHDEPTYILPPLREIPPPRDEPVAALTELGRAEQRLNGARASMTNAARLCKEARRDLRHAEVEFADAAELA